MTPMIGHNGRDRRQSQTAASGFGAEIRFKNFIELLRSNASALVCHGDLYIPFRREGPIHRFIFIQVSRFYLDRAACGYSLSGIDKKIGKQLIHLNQVRFNAPQIVRYRKGYRGIRAGHDQTGGILENFDQILEVFGRRPAFSEEEQLLHQSLDLETALFRHGQPVLQLFRAGGGQ
jgi:hypothetical protein